MSVELKLTAGNKTEQRILDYLLANASEPLADKINAGAKTMAGAMAYAKDEARKLAAGEGVVCVDDDTVFGWIIHYFEEDSIPEGKMTKPIRLPNGVERFDPKPARAKAEKPAKAEKRKPVEPPKDEPQLTMFEALLGSGKA